MPAASKNHVLEVNDDIQVMMFTGDLYKGSVKKVNARTATVKVVHQKSGSFTVSLPKEFVFSGTDKQGRPRYHSVVVGLFQYSYYPPEQKGKKSK